MKKRFAWMNNSYFTFKDGTKVPITIFHRKDIELNAQHPVLAHVYGKYIL